LGTYARPPQESAQYNQPVYAPPLQAEHNGFGGSSITTAPGQQEKCFSLDGLRDVCKIVFREQPVGPSSYQQRGGPASRVQVVTAAAASRPSTDPSGASETDQRLALFRLLQNRPTSQSERSLVAYQPNQQVTVREDNARDEHLHDVQDNTLELRRELREAKRYFRRIEDNRQGVPEHRSLGSRMTRD
jgi:hypothetical protein